MLQFLQILFVMLSVEGETIEPCVGLTAPGLYQAPGASAVFELHYVSDGIPQAQLASVPLADMEVVTELGTHTLVLRTTIPLDRRADPGTSVQTTVHLSLPGGVVLTGPPMPDVP